MDKNNNENKHATYKTIKRQNEHSPTETVRSMSQHSKSLHRYDLELIVVVFWWPYWTSRSGPHHPLKLKCPHPRRTTHQNHRVVFHVVPKLPSRVVFHSVPKLPLLVFLANGFCFLSFIISHDRLLSIANMIDQPV